MSLFSRAWIALWSRLRAWIGEEESGAGSPHPPSVPPPELESLRKHAASLSALASQARLELAERLKQCETLDADVKRLLSEEREADARELLAREAASKAELAECVRHHKAQCRAAEVAVDLFRRREAEWRRTLAAEKNAGRLECAATHAEALRRDAASLPDSAASTGKREPSIDAAPQADPVAAAREALRAPPLTHREEP